MCLLNCWIRGALTWLCLAITYKYAYTTNASTLYPLDSSSHVRRHFDPSFTTRDCHAIFTDGRCIEYLFGMIGRDGLIIGGHDFSRNASWCQVKLQASFFETCHSLPLIDIEILCRLDEQLSRIRAGRCCIIHSYCYCLAGSNSWMAHLEGGTFQL